MNFKKKDGKVVYMMPNAGHPVTGLMTEEQLTKMLETCIDAGACHDVADMNYRITAANGVQYYFITEETEFMNPPETETSKKKKGE